MKFIRADSFIIKPLQYANIYFIVIYWCHNFPASHFSTMLETGKFITCFIACTEHWTLLAQVIEENWIFWPELTLISPGYFGGWVARGGSSPPPPPPSDLGHGLRDRCENLHKGWVRCKLQDCIVRLLFIIIFYFIFINPILTGLFESKFLLGGGGGGSIWPPLQISAPKGPIVAKFCMDVKTHLKSIATEKKLPKTVYLLYYYNLCKLDASNHKFINISNK